MKKLFLGFLILLSITAFAQTVVTEKIVISSDSIIALSQVNAPTLTLISAQGAGKSVIVQSLDVVNKVEDRLYSPLENSANYVVGYGGTYWYTITEIPFDRLNASGNTTKVWSASGLTNLWDDSMVTNVPVQIKFSSPIALESGYNKLTIYITYRVIE